MDTLARKTLACKSLRFLALTAGRLALLPLLAACLGGPSQAQSPVSGDIVRLINQHSGLEADARSLTQTPNDFSSLSQRWKVTRLPSGDWSITSAASGLALGVARRGAITESRDTGTRFQAWRLTPLANGYYGVRSRATGLLLGVNGGAIKPGASLALSAGKPTPGRRWLLRPAFFRGGDVSFLENEEAYRRSAGITGWKDHGAVRDVLEIFQSHGLNLVRVGFSTPPAQPGEMLTNARSLDTAKRARRLGMSLEMTLLLSDGHTQPGIGASPPVPLVWAKDDFAGLEADVQKFCRQTIITCRKRGVMPDLVTLGNEVNSGFLAPAGEIYNSTYSDPTAPKTGLERFDDLQAAAIRGIKEGAADPAGGDPLPAPWIGIHLISNIRSSNAVGYFFDQPGNLALPIDVICESYYPMFHGPLFAAQTKPPSMEDEQDWLQKNAAKTKKPILILETSYSYAPGGTQGSPNAAWWPLTPDGQRQFAADLVRVQQTLPNHLGLGVDWWEPEGVGSGLGYDHDLKEGFFKWEPYTLFTYGDGPSDPNYSSLLPAIDALGDQKP